MKLGLTMKIVYLSSSTFFDKSANSVHVAKMSSAFAKIGYKTTLYTFQHHQSNRNTYKEYAINEDVTLAFYQFPKLRSILFKLIVELYEAVKIHFSFDKSTFFFGRHLMLLYFMKAVFNRNVVCEIHALTNSRLGTWGTGFILSRLDGIVVISNALKNDLIEFYNLPQNKFVVLPDAANHGELDDSYMKENSRFCVGYVGGFYPGRGIELIVKLANHLPNVDFIMIGAEKKNQDDSNLKSVNNNLKVIVYQEHSKLNDYYKEFDIVLAPYGRKISVHGNAGDTSRWASPLKIFEYMAHKKCMLVSDIPVFREVLHDQINCLLCKADDFEDWVDKITLVQKDDILRLKLANKAHADFLDNYTWDKRAAKLINFIEN